MPGLQQDSRDPNPKQPIHSSKPQSFVIAVEKGELLSKREILERQLATLLKPKAQQGNHAE
jgi:hypothetical protein